MALKGRKWEAIDIAFSQIFNELREDNGNASLRNMAENIGLTHTRVRDLLNAENGTPTLNEYLLICRYYKLSPAKVIQEIIERSQQKPENTTTETVKNIEDTFDPWALVANIDNNKKTERDEVYD